MGICTKWWGKALDFLVLQESRDEVHLTDEELLDSAHQELVQALSLFAQAEDPAMIDSAIFRLKAAEQRYDYLVRRIKEQRGCCGFHQEKGELDGNR